MSNPADTTAAISSAPPASATSGLAGKVRTVGRLVALLGVVLPLLLIGLNKFMPFEVELLKPLIAGTPWLSWLPLVFGDVGTARLLGTVEIATALLFIAVPWSPRAALAAGLIGSGTFAVTSSTLLALPIWEPSAGGFPFLNFSGTFLIKDIALLGVSLVVLSEGLARTGLGRR